MIDLLTMVIVALMFVGLALLVELCDAVRPR